MSEMLVTMLENPYEKGGIHVHNGLWMYRRDGGPDRRDPEHAGTGLHMDDRILGAD
jgi:hypothetical protein